MSNIKRCAICRDSGVPLHRVNLQYWPPLDLLNKDGKKICEDDRICCKHFQPHVDEMGKHMNFTRDRPPIYSSNRSANQLVVQKDQEEEKVKEQLKRLVKREKSKKREKREEKMRESEEIQKPKKMLRVMRRSDENMYDRIKAIDTQIADLIAEKRRCYNNLQMEMKNVIPIQGLLTTDLMDDAAFSLSSGFGRHKEVMKKYMKLADEALLFNNVQNRDLKLRVFLYILFNGSSARIMEGVCWGPSKSTISGWMGEVRAALEKFSENMVGDFSIKDWIEDNEKLEKSEFNDLLAFAVDGTFLQTWKRDDIGDAKELYCYKNNCPAYLTFVLVTMKGRIVYVCNEVATGSIGDSNHWKLSNVQQFLRKFGDGPIKYNGRNYQKAIFGDKAYPNIEVPPNWMLYITKTGEKTFLDGSYCEGGDKSHVIFNPAIAQYRSVVERTFQKLKKYRILESSWNCNLITCKTYFTIICAIMNFIQKNKNKKFQQL